MLGDSPYLMFLLFVVITINLMFFFMGKAVSTSNLCMELTDKYYNFTTELNNTNEDVYEDVKNAKCSGLPTWYYVVFNAPILLVIGLVIKKYVLI